MINFEMNTNQMVQQMMTTPNTKKDQELW
jgi:hypothetical protein